MIALKVLFDVSKYGQNNRLNFLPLTFSLTLTQGDAKLCYTDTSGHSKYCGTPL